jgi:RNA polymerase sigma-70 factor (ECF subfamily)
LALTLHRPLRDHFAGNAEVEVVVERRRGERRTASERRGPSREGGGAEDRRRIRNPSGRRVGERRAPVIEVDTPPPLPGVAAPHADRLRFVERLEPSTQHAEDLDTARLVALFQAGDTDAFTALYIRYFDRVYAYLHMLLGDAESAEDATHEAFARIFEELPSYERGRRPVRAWLFSAVREAAVSRLRAPENAGIEDPLPAGSELERAAHEDEELHALHWVTDRDLQLLVEHLPPAQRQVLLLRYMLDLPSSEVAEIIGRTQDEVRELQDRAVTVMRGELKGMGSRENEPELPANES